MPCHAAIADKTVSLKADLTVEDALKTLKKAKCEGAAVIDENNVVIGFFSPQVLMKNLLPVSVAMADGIQLDVTVRAAPGIAKRLKKVMPLPVQDLMERKHFPVVYPQTPLWEGVNLIVTSGMPLVVVDHQTNKYIGFITQSSMMTELQRLQDSDVS
ncbi:MAG: CBS domain-containing protein [Bdellovibrionales bacterium]